MVAISIKNETVIDRMMNELVKAKEQRDNIKQMNRHIENVQLLCDIILADDQSLKNVSKAGVDSTSRADITEQEMKAMIIGQQTKSNKVQTEQLKQLRTGSNIDDDDDGNGDSLFDF